MDSEMSAAAAGECLPGDRGHSRANRQAVLPIFAWKVLQKGILPRAKRRAAPLEHPKGPGSTGQAKNRKKRGKSVGRKLIGALVARVLR
jgi:hypothetical protein